MRASCGSVKDVIELLAAFDRRILDDAERVSRVGLSKDQARPARGPNMNEYKTIWRQVLADDWSERRARTDWMGIPQMHDHVNEVMTGGTRAENGDWIDYSLRSHLRRLLERRDPHGSKTKGLSLVSFGCGPGTIEQEFLRRGWPIDRIVCREYDTELLSRARQNLAQFDIRKDFEQFDFNNPEENAFEKFDVAFFCHSLHHCADIERFLAYLNLVVNDDGIILGVDYFGPPRLQIAFESIKIINDIFSALPDRLRANLACEGVIDETFSVPTIAECRSGDPSEAPRSSDLRALLFATFPVIDVLPMGGTLLRPLLAYRAGNFQTEEDLCILRLTSILERELIRGRLITSDFLYFVLGRSSRLPQA
jgi:SAM-dependent methyltransferase